MKYFETCLLLLTIAVASVTSYTKSDLINSTKAQFSHQRNGTIGLHGPKSCPPWSYFSHHANACKCHEAPSSALQCRGEELLLYVLTCNCATYNEGRKLIEFGHCGLTCVKFHEEEKHSQHHIYHLLPKNLSQLNNFMCGENKRSGSLCGKCAESFFPHAYSFDSTCVKCEHSTWLIYILVAYLPLVLFYLLILLFEVNIHSSWMFGFVILSQQISMSPFLRISYSYALKLRLLPLWKILGLFYGIWNLDFFRIYSLRICLQVNTLVVPLLDLIIAIFPLLLMVLTYALISLHDRNIRVVVLLWQPLHSFFQFFKKNWNIRTSIIDAFATFYLLISNKITWVSFDLLNPVNVYQLSVHTQSFNSSSRLYYDASVHYFSARHLPYVIIALITFITLVFVPVSVFLLHPFRFFHCFVSMLPSRWQIYLHTFVDTFHGCYKDGTDIGESDCRWFPGVILLARIMVALTFSFYKDSVFLPTASMIFVFAAIITIITDPFKRDIRKYSTILVTFFLFIAIISTSTSAYDIAGVKHFYATKLISYFHLTVAALPLLTVLVYVLFWAVNFFRSNRTRKNYCMIQL